MNQMQDWLAARATLDRLAIYERNMGFRVETYYPTLQIETIHICYHFAKLDFQKGDRIAVLMNSNHLYAAIIHACIRLNLIIVPINTRLAPEEISWQLANTQSRILLYDQTHSKKAETIQSLGHRIALFSEDNLAESDYTQITEAGRVNWSGKIDMEDPFAIIHTSGTSGKPKGAVLSYGNMFYAAMASAYRIGHIPDDKWLCVLPLYHVGGLSILIRAVLYGITVDLRQKFDVDEINHALSHEDITLVSLVPTMLYRLLEARKGAWNSKLRLVLVGGAATTRELIERCKTENIPIATTYGLTEAASQVATTLPEDAIRKVGTVGKPLMFTQVRVVDENGDNQPQGEYGEILVTGPTVMQGYYGDEEATKKAIQDGWLHTGDIGYFDAEGDLFLVQRRSDLIVSGGENIYPSEIEAVLRKHPSIKEVAIVGIEDAEWGQKVAAAIILENGASLSKDEIETYSREHLAGYKIPRIIKFVEALPLTGSGKIQRNAIKDLFH